MARALENIGIEAFDLLESGVVFNFDLLDNGSMFQCVALQDRHTLLVFLGQSSRLFLVLMIESICVLLVFLIQSSHEVLFLLDPSGRQFVFFLLVTLIVFVPFDSLFRFQIVNDFVMTRDLLFGLFESFVMSINEALVEFLHKFQPTRSSNAFDLSKCLKPTKLAHKFRHSRVEGAC